LVKYCNDCGSPTEQDDAIFCSHCGTRYDETQLDVLRDIRASLQKKQIKSDEIAQVQIKISYATLIFAIVAYFIAIGALAMATYTLSPDAMIYGMILLVLIGIITTIFLKKYHKLRIDELEIQK
jgi:uncharacterized membrane protein YvbJ